jgi:ACS family glucarate transporter-like MFS transporter
MGQPGSVNPRPSRVRYQVLAAGCLLALLTYVQRLGFSSALPEIKENLRLNDEHSGYLSAAFLIAYGGFQMVGGFLGDRFGARHVLTILVLGWSALTGAVALTVLFPAVAALQFGILLVRRFLFGTLQAGGFPAWARVIADWMPVRERGMAQGIVWGFSRLGGAMSPFIFLWLFQFFGTWTTPFWILAAMGLVWCGFFFPWFRNRPEETSRVNAAEQDLIVSGRSLAAGLPTLDQPAAVPWSQMLGSLSVWGLCLMYGFVGFAGNFITSLLPVYLKDHRHLEAEDRTWVFGLTLACGMLACVLGGFLSDGIIRWTGSRKWGRRLSGMIGLVFAGAANLAVPWVDGAYFLAVLFCAAFFFNDFTMGPAWAACADIGERHAGTLSGAMNMIGAFAGAAGTALAGVLLELKRYELLFAVFACSYGAAALCWLAVDVTQPLPDSVPAGSA